MLKGIWENSFCKWLNYQKSLIKHFLSRFRDKFNADLSEKKYFNREVFSTFTSDFERILRAVENATQKDKQAGPKMKTFGESAKSQKTIASLLENPEANSAVKTNSVGNNNNKTEQVTFKENIEPVRLFDNN